MLHLYLLVELFLVNMHRMKHYHIYSLLSQLNNLSMMDMDRFHLNMYLDGMENIVSRSDHLVHFYNEFHIWDTMILHLGKYFVHIFLARAQ